MPQQPRKPTFEELLAGAPPAPTPTPGPTFEELLAGAAPPQQTPQQPQDDWSTRFRRNVGIAAEQGYVSLKDKAGALGEIVGGVTTGNFHPLLEAGESVARGAGNLLMGGNPSFVTPARANQQAIANVDARQTARRQAGGDTSFQLRAEEMARLEAAAQAYDPSLTGRITRGVVREGIKLAPTLVAGAVSGGSIPAITATTAATSLDEPENLPLATALAAVPLPLARAVRSTAPAVERVLGKGAAQIVEAEARQAAGATARSALAPAVSGQIRAAGPSIEEAAIRAAAPSANLDLAIIEAASEIPPSLAQRVGSEVAALYQMPRALVASMDVSAPLRQGALLTLPPSQWGRAARAGLKMFESFSTKRYNRIVEEIAAHPDSQIAQRAGLHLSTQAKTGLKKSEEDFVSKYASRIPGVKHSQQAYQGYLDNLRLSTFFKYKALIDKRGLSPEATEQAYQASARWLNIASGRGSFGQTVDKGMDALNNVLFAPRFLASRINILDPRTYMRNLSTEGGRVVLRQQMSELMQAAGVLASTAALAKAAGATVSLGPGSPDFLKIKFGNRRFDLLAGEQQVMRLIYRVAAAVTRSAKGEKSKPGEGALDVAGRFVRSKLAPVPSFFVDFLTRKTYTGRDFDAAKGVAQRVAPLVWQDFLDAYMKEGFGGVAATTPGLFGVGVQLYDDNSLLNRAQPVFSEFVRAGRSIPEIRKLKDEGDDQFNARVKVFGEALETYGLQLVTSDEYRNADTATQDKALDLLPRRIGSALMKQGEAWQLQPRVLVFDARESIQSEGQREPRRLYGVGGERLR